MVGEITEKTSEESGEKSGQAERELSISKVQAHVPYQYSSTASIVSSEIHDTLVQMLMTGDNLPMNYVSVIFMRVASLVVMEWLRGMFLVSTVPTTFGNVLRMKLDERFAVNNWYNIVNGGSTMNITVPVHFFVRRELLC